jgi:16S rRNA processing protein RimM
MLLIVGQILRPHGIRGEVLVDVRTDDPAERFAAGSVLVTDPAPVRSERSTVPSARPEAMPELPDSARWRVPPTLTVATARPHHGRLIVSFDGIDDRNLADEMRGVLLRVDSADIPASSDPDEFADHELVGLVAVDLAGQRLGEIERVDHAPASDLLVLRKPDGGSALVPFVRAIVPEVDLAAGRIVLTPPEGLLDL